MQTIQPVATLSLAADLVRTIEKAERESGGLITQQLLKSAAALAKALDRHGVQTPIPRQR